MWIVIIGIIVIAGVAYAGRHQLKSIFVRPSPTPAKFAMPTVPVTATSAPNQTPVLTTTRIDPKKGSYLADTRGMTLYIFDKDKPGVSNCTGGCLTIWPPYTTQIAPASMPTNVTIIKRDDGSMQYAWKNMPLYYYSKDKAIGDILGDGVNGTWHLVKP